MSTSTFTLYQITCVCSTNNYKRPMVQLFSTDETLSTILKMWSGSLLLDKQFLMSPFVKLLGKPPIMLPNMKYISLRYHFFLTISSTCKNKLLIKILIDLACMYKFISRNWRSKGLRGIRSLRNSMSIENVWTHSENCS